jgi:hypothetical protein
VAAWDKHRPLDTCHARLGRAVEISVKDGNPKTLRTESACEVQRQGALADSAFAGTDGHEMAHPGQTVCDPGALLGNLFEDPGSSVADDVVIALHSKRGF